MSTIKVTNLQNASAASPAIVLDANSRATLNGLSYPTEGSLSGRNRIINGDMRIDQRNAGASATATSTASYCVDRFLAGMVGANGTMQRVSSGRTDFPFALRLTGTASTTVCWAAQRIESFNCADLVGQSVTISFYAAASALTGLSVNFSYANAADNFGSITSIGAQSKTITSTLTQYSVTFTSLPAGTANGLYLEFVPNGNLGTGTFTITGVQLEAGSVATPFERRSYGQELALCQRYFATVGDGGNPYAVLADGRFSSATVCSCRFRLPVTMRATPSATAASATYALWDCYNLGNARSVGAITIYSAGSDGVEGDIVTSSATNGAYAQLRGNAAAPNAPRILFSAEL